MVGEVTNINPPEDYFDRISDDAPQVEEANKEEADEERDSRESWMKKLDEKGIPYDKRWGAAKLQAEFINGTKGL